VTPDEPKLRGLRIGILFQEDPVFFGPFLKGLLSLRPGGVVILFRSGSRGAGGHPRTLSQKLSYLATLWLLFEPAGFFRFLLVKVFSVVLRAMGPLDLLSVTAKARRLGIPVESCGDPNAPEFLERLRAERLDVVLNQTEILLKPPLLAIPTVGFVNRHGSLLPSFRGRLASFWSHAAEPPCEGVTFHKVDAGLDTGPIIIQRALLIDPRWSYTRVVREHLSFSPALFWEAMDLLSQPGFQFQANPHEGTPTCRFPTRDQAAQYRARLAARRKGEASPPM
jgi:hypothetical protein